MSFNSFDQQEWWISGGLWYPPIAGVASALRLDLLYRETGLIRLAASRGTAAIWWDVDNVDPESLHEAVAYLETLEDRPRCVTLNFMKVGWAREYHGSTDGALARIEEIQSFRGVDLLPDTRVHHVPLAEIGSCTELLRRASEVVDCAGWFDRLLRGSLARYGLFFERTNASGPLTFSYVGEDSECARVLGNAWRRQAVGCPCNSAFADSRFDLRVSAFYEVSLAAQEPLLQHIVGLLDVGPHRIWVPYQRLLLPHGDRLACFVSITWSLLCPFLALESRPTFGPNVAGVGVLALP